MPRREEILSNMRVYLQGQDPQWDISPGTPEFKILEAVAQQLEGISFDGLLSTYHFDIDKKAGAELDLFLALFGFYRQRSVRATGNVILRRGSEAPTDLSIPLGTQVFAPASNGNPSVYFSTTAAAIINQGERQVVVPIEATIGGTTGNVPAYSITSFASLANNVTEVYNPSPTSGGANAESDEAFRERFRRTFLRSLAGTENQFAGIALAETGLVNKVSVISPVENYREQIQFYPIDNLSSSTPYQITGNDIAGQKNNFPAMDRVSSFLVAAFNSSELVSLHRFTVSGNSWSIVPSLPGSYSKLLVAYESSVRDAKYIFPPGSEIVGSSLDTTYEILAKPNSELDLKLEVSDYAMVVEEPSSGAPADVNYPVFVFSSSGVMRLGGPETVITAQFEYTPIASRNEPPAVMNKMDLYVHGRDENNISEQVYMVQTDNSTFSSSALTSSDYVRDDGETNPRTNNIFTLLGRNPVVSIPSSITVNRFAAIDPDDQDNPKYHLDESQIYYKDEDYWFITKPKVDGNYNVFSGTRNSIEGIEWNTPLTASLVQEGANDTYAKPIKSQGNDAAPFSVYQSNYSGKLNGYYAYVFTWEADGKESIASNPVALNANVSNKQILFHFDSGIKSTYAVGTGAVYNSLENSESNAIYRKIYRSKAAASAAEAEQGPFYLVKVIRNNDGNVYWLDNTTDDNLGFTTPPKIPPPHGAPIDLNYTYNSLIERLDNRMDLVRLVGQDIMTHQAKEVPVKFNLAVVPAFNSSYNSVRLGVIAALQRFLDSKSFGPDLQIADLIAAVETATEVDNVRLLTNNEVSDESFEIQTSSPAELTDTDTMVISVDEYSTAELTANEQGYIVREALESLPIFEPGDTYATFLTSALGLTGQDNFLEDETTLTVWDNSNAARIQELFEDPEVENLYLQITQLGDANLQKDEIVKVTGIGEDFPPAIKRYDVLAKSVSGSAVTLTTAIQGLDIGDEITIYNSSNSDLGSFTLTQVASNSVTFNNSSGLTTNQINSIDYFEFQLSEGSRSFTVARAQLGSIKRHYGNGTDNVNNDVLRAGTEAWVHILGDISVAKNESANKKEITYVINLLNNPFTPTNNWGSRSLYDANNAYRVQVTASGNSSSSVVRKTAGLGSGIQILAPNRRNILNTFDEDIYFDSNEVLVFGGLDLVLRARNTFNA